MYNSIDAVPRADISTVLMEAVSQEKEFIAQKIFPVYPSATEVGRYPKFRIASGSLLRNYKGSTKRQATGGYSETERKFEWDSYQTEEYGLEERVDDKVKNQMENFFDAEVITSKLLMNTLMLDYETQVAAATQDPTVFAVINASVAYTEANIETFDVPFDMNAVIEQQTLLGEVPEVAIMPLQLWNRIRRSKKLQLYVYGYLNVSQGGSQITPDMFAQVFGLKELIIARKSIDLSNPGSTTPNLVPVWSPSYIAVGRLGEGDFMNGGMGRTIVWDSDSPGGLFTTESYRDEKRRGDMLRVRTNRVQKVVNPLAMSLIATSWA